MTELWVTSTVVVSWVLAAGLAGIIATFLVPRFRDRSLARQTARELSEPSGR